jgi:acetylornithine deacetylase/succinyl-diaminopimelate desuccinylase-like protein
MKDERERILIDGFYDNVPEPTERDMELLKKISFDEKSYKDVFGIKDFVLGLKGLELLKKHLFQPTCTISGLKAGYIGEGEGAVNPASAMAKVDFRLVGEQTPDEIFEKVKSHLKKHGFDDIEVVRVTEAQVAKSDPDAEIVKTVIKSARKVYGMEPSVWPTSPASGPMHLFVRTLGIPVAGSGVSHAGSGMHGPNENIKIEDYILAIKHIANIIQTF